MKLLRVLTIPMIITPGCKGLTNVLAGCKGLRKVLAGCKGLMDMPVTLGYKGLMKHLGNLDFEHSIVVGATHAEVIGLVDQE